MDATARPVLVEMYPAMWLTKGAAKSQLPVRVREVEQLRKCLEFDEDVKLAAIGDDDALDALAILGGLHERDPAVELTRPLPEAAETEGWIWGVDPVSDANQRP